MNGQDRLTALAQSTHDRFVACGKADLAPDVNKLRGVFYNMKRKYLNNYADEDTKLDILTDAWITTVLGREDKVIRAFTGLNTAPSRVGQRVKAEEWIAMVVKNAMINISKRYSQASLDLNPSDENDESWSLDSHHRNTSRIERIDQDYLDTLTSYIADAKATLETLPADKTMSRRRLTSSIARLEAEYSNLVNPTSAPQNDPSDIYSYYDDAVNGDDDDYTRRLVNSMLVSLTPQAQAMFIGLFYGMTPNELGFAFGWDIMANLTEIKKALKSTAKDESWEHDNHDLLNALDGISMGQRDLTRVKADVTREELQERYQECLEDFTGEFRYEFKAQQLRKIAFGV